VSWDKYANRFSTIYFITLDRRSVKFMAHAMQFDTSIWALSLDAITRVWLDPRNRQILYEIRDKLDNEYVHKALRKRLRVYLNELRREAKAQKAATALQNVKGKQA
jgi:hypothetical protein